MELYKVTYMVTYVASREQQIIYYATDDPKKIYDELKTYHIDKVEWIDNIEVLK